MCAASTIATPLGNTSLEPDAAQLAADNYLERSATTILSG
jgi:hypothetical protein